MSSLIGFEPAPFPPPSTDRQRSARECIELVIGDAAAQAPANTLAVAWGAVLASFTSASDVLFGFGSGSSVRPCALRLLPEDSTAAVFAQVEATDAPDAPDEAIQKFHNILVIHDGENLATTYPLQIHCVVQQDSIKIQAVFDADLLPPDTLRMMLFQLRHAYAQIARNPQASIADIQETSPEGLAQLIQWNSQNAPRRVDALAHHFIEQRCREQPSAPAICAWDGTLTYAELDALASKIAAGLVAAGVGPDRFVGLLMEKSMWTTVAILAVLKAGGCFCLLDASHPAPRLALMCGKARPVLVLASAKHEALASVLDIPVWVVPRDMQAAEGSSQPPAAPVQPHHIMYAGFTSGSTGEPKGFVMDHTAFASGIATYAQQAGVTAQSRVLQYASYAFIVSLTDQLVPLAQGGCLCVPSNQQLQDDLLGAIHGYGANWAKLTPSVLRLLDPAALSGLQTLVMVGEPMAGSELAKWQHRGINLLSLYGQSENSKGCSFGDRNEPGCDVRQFARPHCATPWVVSPQDPNILLPLGAEGELLLEGPSLSRGYLDNEEQNQMTYVHDPAWLKHIRPQGHVRLLKTGDLVRYNPQDGTLYLVGRKGTQVKIRGQRIELAEVEHHLSPLFDSNEPAVVDVVIPSDDTAQNKLLVAFVPVGEQHPALHRDGLIEHLFATPTPDFRHKARSALSKLHQTIPSFMIPSAVVATVALPRTMTGKLNRRMLREEASKLSRQDLLAYTSEEAAHQSPSTPREILLQDKCARVLNLSLETVGMQSNFFDLGGNSITARELVTKCRQSGLHLTVADLFRSSCLGALAQCHKDPDASLQTELDDPFKAIRNELLANLPPSLTADQIEDAFPTLEEQHSLASTHMLDYHLYAIDGPVNASQLQRACQTLVDKHTILRSVFIPFQEDILQVTLRHVDVPFTVHDPEGQPAQAWATSFCQRELKKTYPADEPRVAFSLVQDTPDSSILIIRLLHAQYDAIGLQKLVSDLSAAYQGQAIHIESDFGAYARECCRQRTPEAYTFWRGLLHESQITPAPFRAVPVPAEESACFEREMPSPTAPAGTTLATVVKVAWAKVLAQWTGAADVVFGQLISARNLLLPGVDDVVGPCMNTVPVRVHMAPSSGNLHLLRSVQAQHAASISCETIGWNDLVETCTAWPARTKPGSVVLFQNWNTGSPQTQTQAQSGALRVHNTAHFLDLPPEDVVWLLVYPAPSTLSFAVEASNSRLRKGEVEPLLDRLCEAVRELCS